MLENVFANDSVLSLAKSDALLNHLKALPTVNLMGRSRILMHKTHEDLPQIMLIYLRKDSEIGQHRHPTEKAEIYVVLEGELEVRYQVTTDTPEQVRVLGAWGNTRGLPSISVHRDGVWHEPRAVSEDCLYLEIYSGPFSKDADVEYR